MNLVAGGVLSSLITKFTSYEGRKYLTEIAAICNLCIIFHFLPFHELHGTSRKTTFGNISVYIIYNSQEIKTITGGGGSFEIKTHLKKCIVHYTSRRQLSRKRNERSSTHERIFDIYTMIQFALWPSI